MARTIETPIQQRFSDIDPFNHVNNVAQQMYFDTGKLDYYKSIFGQDVLLGNLRIVAVSTSTSYIQQVRMYAPVRVTTTCERVGNKSLTLFQQLFADNQLCSESRSVMVVFDFSTQQGIPVSEEWRQLRLGE